MTLYTKEEEEIWKCKKHPSKQHNNIGICPHCLKERLSALCPNCAQLRPCSCSCSSFSSSSDSSTFSLDILETRVSTLIETEPRRSNFPFFRSARFSTAENTSEEVRKSSLSSSIWSMFSKRNSTRDKMTRSKSVSLSLSGNAKMPKKWYFMSPLNVFRYGKASKVDQERSPINS